MTEAHGCYSTDDWIDTSGLMAVQVWCARQAHCAHGFALQYFTCYARSRQFGYHGISSHLVSERILFNVPTRLTAIRVFDNGGYGIAVLQFFRLVECHVYHSPMKT